MMPRSSSLRKNAVSLIGLVLFSAADASGKPKAHAGIQQAGTRVLENQIPNHVPIRIRIRPEKEAAFKKIENEQWASDFELEVKNTGDKPIYFFQFSLVMPDMTPGTQNPAGFAILYGRPDLVELDTPLTGEDIPLKPGESTFVKINQMDVDAWKHFRKVGNWQFPTTTILYFERMNFGNGTGLDGGEARPWPETKRPA